MRIPEGQWELISPVSDWVRARLRDARLARGFTQQHLGVLIGNSSVGGTRVSDFESGRGDAQLSTVLRHARALGVNMDRLFLGCPTWGKRSVSAPLVKSEVVIMGRDELEAIIRGATTPAAAEKVIEAINTSLANGG